MNTYDKTSRLQIAFEDLEQAKFDIVDGKIVVRTLSHGDYHTNALLTLQFYAAKGMSLDEVENQYNIDFVVGANCVPVLKEGKLVVIDRKVI